MIIIETQFPTPDPLLVGDFNDLEFWDYDEIFRMEKRMSIQCGFTVLEEEKHICDVEFYHHNLDNENRLLQQLNEVLKDEPTTH